MRTQCPPSILSCGVIAQGFPEANCCCADPGKATPIYAAPNIETAECTSSKLLVFTGANPAILLLPNSPFVYHARSTSTSTAPLSCPPVIVKYCFTMSSSLGIASHVMLVALAASIRCPTPATVQSPSLSLAITPHNLTPGTGTAGGGGAR